MSLSEVPIVNRLIRRLYPYGSVRTVLLGPARNRRVVIEPGIGVSYIFGTDSAAPHFFRQVVRPGMTVVDLGANKGQMALLFAALVGPKGRVIAWEPAPAEFASLQRNVQINEIENISVLQAAAADSWGERMFSYSPGNPTQGKLADVEESYQVADTESFPVSARPLDILLETRVVPDFIKIDVEGSAGAVLRGARRILDEAKPAVYVELHGPDEQRAINDELLARGYSVSTLDGRIVSDATAGWFSPLWCVADGDRHVAQPIESQRR